MITSTEVFSVIGMVLLVFTGLVMYIVRVKDATVLRQEDKRNEILTEHEKNRDVSLDNKITSVFLKIDENRKSISDLNDKLNQKYHDKVEMEKYIALVNAPVLGQVQHLNTKLDELTILVKIGFENKDRG